MTEPKKAGRSRVDRGRATEALLAARWRRMVLFPHSQNTGAGRAGRDLLNTPGLFVEVKARGEVSLPSQLRKAQRHSIAERRAEEMRDGEAPDVAVIVWRHNGQGEASMADWTVTMRLEDFEDLIFMRDDYRTLRLTLREASARDEKQ